MRNLIGARAEEKEDDTKGISTDETKTENEPFNHVVSSTLFFLLLSGFKCFANW